MLSPAQPDSGAIAIIAVSGRFPGAPTVERFWSNLCAGIESISRYTDAELEAFGVPSELRRDPRFVPVGALLEGIEQFDAALFGFTPREAEVLDPQHRLFFECVWDSLERAGYAPGSVDAPIGLFAGTSFSGYLIHNLLAEAEAIRSVGLYQTYIGNDKDSLTTYVAYKLNLRGPSVTLQTACSTSLVAVQFACQSLLGYQCDMAIAGGVSLQMPHLPGYLYQDGAIASPDGHCRAFDASAEGTVPGSGVGVVVLKRLEDALADGDAIVAIIRGSAVNNDGSGKVGYTAPGADGQAEVIALAHAVAGTPPDSVGYVEAHGTGTPLGDPIEIASLTRVFRARSQRTQFCALGSVKTNIGHLDAAAGVAGLIKAALAVERATIPASLHFDRPNPKAALDQSPFFVPTTTMAWPAADGPRRAAVSSFGIGGTNAHVVIEETPARQPSGVSRDALILSLSARSEGSLTQLAQAVAERLEAPDAPPLSDAAFTLHLGRRAWPHRASVVCRTREDAVSALRALRQAGAAQAGATAERPAAFLFPGQGSQYPGMGRRLYESEPVVRTEIDACCALLRPLIGLDLRELLLAADMGDTAEQLRQTALAQPVIFVIEYALARLWMSWGVRPAAMIGHSIGEYAAACVAGVISRDDALRLVAARGRLMQALPRGAMLAIAASAEAVSKLLSNEVSIAAVNAPASVVASGTIAGIDRLATELSRQGIAHQRLDTSHAFHSSMVAPILDAFHAEVRGVRLSAPAIPYVSGVTGSWITAAMATDPAYWVRHLRDTVMFGQGLITLLADGRYLPLEAGPGRTLAGLVRQVPARSAGPAPVSSMPRRDAGIDEGTAIAEALSQVWTQGVAVDWAAYYRGQTRHRVLMPTTPFERQRYWIDPPARVAAAPAMARQQVDRWLYAPEWILTPISDRGGQPAHQAEVIVVGPAATARQLADYLGAHGHHARVVEASVPSDLRERLAGMLAAETALTMCSLSALADESDAAGSDDARRDAFDMPLAIAQALADARVSAPVTLLLAVNRLFAAKPIARPEDRARIKVERAHGDTFAPLRALITGPALVMPQEHRNVTCRVVDLDLARVADGDDSWMRHIADEIRASADHTAVAYRGDDRYARAFRSAALGPTRPRLARRGIYWITGASGGIGYALAEHLARTYQARLVLTSRTPLPATFLAALESTGGEVIALAVDVTDRDAMRRATEAAVQRFGRIDGIIHAAGVAGGGLVAFKTAAAVDAVLAPKVDGTLAVADAARAGGAQFIALCSSLAAVQGGFGQVDYVAANAALDAFAEWHTRCSGIFTVSIGWDAWRETGMAVKVTADLRARAAHPPVGVNDDGRHAGDGVQSASATAADAGVQGLSTRDGIAVFERILAGDVPIVAVSIQPLGERLRQQRDGTQMLTDAAGPGRRSGARVSPELAGLSLEAQVAELWRQVLGIPDIASDASFFDVGGDSLKGVQLMAHLNEHLGLQLPVARFFGAPTIASLAALIREAGVGTARDASVPADASLDASRERGRRRGARRAGRETTVA